MTSIIIIAITAIVVLYLGLYKVKGALLPVSVLGLLGAEASLVCGWDKNISYFNEMLVFNNYAIAFSILLIATTILIFLMSGNYFEKISSNVAEYYTILLFALTGGITMVSFQNMTMLFIGIEILSVSMYIMAGIKKNDTSSNEAALKYFLMGSFATGILLFGIALIYGATGSFNLTEIAGKASEQPFLFYTGVIFMLIAMTFKVGAAPFHFWTPDVYQGAPTLVTSYMSTVVKTAGFAAFLRLFGSAFSSVPPIWTVTIAAMVVITLLIGNITAAFQQNVKRMLAYSSISHAGYMLIAILLLGQASPNAILIYSVAYSIASVASFGVIVAVKEHKGSDDLSAFNGLGRTNPVLAFVMTVALCSLGGIPLTAGFFGKFYIFGVAIAANYTWLIAIAVLMAAVGIYYYFKVIIAMYLRDSESGESIQLNGSYQFVLIFCVLVTILLGIAPSLITNIL
ncbi:NADH-quinone oxidoreductase subunit N [Solitalea sp. MAHUQ-68]|uniref:NADH-quinone oxidoreductase subunit N n=1 Tax=Solitalea agri TaxID=2953739 RepID=A0A9X2EYJ8_9SPHI|nr:NADH-quinone oxidoreductase subunit N [Solitalea agri]MCO4291282.1 NADH-quinone oxidoreductase subunit N [Solitalea agri]